MEGVSGLLCNHEAHKSSLLQHGMLNSVLRSFKSCGFSFTVISCLMLTHNFSGHSVYKMYILFCFHHMFWLCGFLLHYPSCFVACVMMLTAADISFLSSLDCSLSLHQNLGKWPLEKFGFSFFVNTERSLSAPVQFCTISRWECRKFRVKDISSSLSQQGQK